MLPAYIKIKNIANKIIPNSIWSILRKTKNNVELLLFAPVKLPLHHALKMIGPRWCIHRNIECGHTQRELIEVVAAIFSIPESTTGVIVEAGCWKGGSSAKLSLACSRVERKLIIFDSFQGIPPNLENPSVSIYGLLSEFPEGSYSGSIEEVKNSINRFGKIDYCDFMMGWFEDTMPDFSLPIAGAFLDVDLESSMRTCLKYLYPLLQPGGFIYTHDGHLPLIIDLLRDRTFWLEEVGVSEIPQMVGLGTEKLVQIRKQ